MKEQTQLLTNSRRECFQVCRKKHQFAYELGLRRTEDGKALRMGSAGHAGVETLGNTDNIDLACQAVNTHYENRPHFIDEWKWNIERETVLRLVCAYQWRWQAHKLKYRAVERGFELPLVNPCTGKATASFKMAGKIDAIVTLEDGRDAVKETKFLGEEIGPDGDLWKRMKMDQQVSMYMIASRRLGFPVATVLYDVVRKPTIKPESVPILDELGAKIVLDKWGGRVKTERGLWRQTGDKERGYTLQQRAMTPEEWGEKLTNDIVSRPDFYFARVEIPRLDRELKEFEYELWDVQLSIREAQRNGRWFRTVNRNTCPHCDYFSICSSGLDITGALPDGFTFVNDKHPELLRENQDGNSTHADEPAHGSESEATGTTAASIGEGRPAAVAT